MVGACVLGLACTDDTTADGLDDGMEAASNSGAEAGTGDTGDGDGDSVPFEPIPARGNISLTEVVVNQGVDVPISNDGVWVGPADRNTFVVGNRDTLLRGYWELPEGWQGRDISARLDLRYPDGTEETYFDTKFIDAPSFPGDLDRAFFFPLVAEQFPPGLQYHMSLWEAAPGAEGLPESETILDSPLEGFELVGAQPEPAQLKVVMMPVAYTAPGCSTNTADEVGEAEEQRFQDYLHEQYPIQELFWEFRRDTPIQWEGELTSLAQLWAPLQEQRVIDEADANVYYYALVDACAGGIDGAGGIAPSIAPATKDAAFERVSSGLWIPDNKDFGHHTMVHELGHNHGRAHVFCAAGDAAGPDPTYPHNDGTIGVWGFGIRLFRLHSPTGSWDIMTYCSPNWVSDWGWSKAYSRIRSLTAWDFESPAQPPSEPASAGAEVLFGLLLNDGTEQWWTTPGAREPEYYSSGEFIAFDYGDEVLDAPAHVETLEDGTTMITAPVPRGHVAFEAASRIDLDLDRDGGERRAIVLDRPELRSWSL